MKGTKFMVVRLKEVLKTAVFALLGVIILFALVRFFLGLGEENADAAYRDGTYYGTLAAGDEGALVAVTVEEGKISAVRLENKSENLSVFYPKIETVAELVEEEVVRTQALQATVGEDSVYSAKAVLQALADGLEQAKK